MRYTSLEWIAVALVAVFLIGPLSAGMLGSRYASTETKVKSDAPSASPEDTKK